MSEQENRKLEQERFVKVYELAGLGAKAKLKSIYGSGSVLYAYNQSKKGVYTRYAVIKEMTEVLGGIVKSIKDDALNMHNKIKEI